MFRPMIACALFLASSASHGQTNPVLAPGFQLEGQSAAQLSASWWKWAMASPRESNPVSDLTGGLCANGQQGNVWFLAGGFGSSKISRKCEVPFGKSLFFPVVNMMYYPTAENNGYTCADARRNAAYNNQRAVDLFAEIDGVAVKDVDRYRARTPECFNILERVGPARGSYNAYPSASDGFWIGLNPLSKGVHKLKFGGRYNRGSADYGRMVQDIEYEITVR